MAEGRYYIVMDCYECPNMREFGNRVITIRCGNMNDKKIKYAFKIPEWCPLQKVKKDK